VRFSSTAAGAPIEVSDCNGAASQKFVVQGSYWLLRAAGAVCDYRFK
jgi:hypothetical protein